MKRKLGIILLLFSVVLQADTEIDSDDFQRVNSLPIDGSWATATGCVAYNLVDTEASPAGGVTVSWVYNTTGGYTTDQYAEAVVDYNASALSYIGIAVRMQSGACSGYELAVYNGSYLLRKMTGGVDSLSETLTATPVDGDELRIECSGTTTTTCTAVINGVPDLDDIVVDSSSPYTTGVPGMSGFGNLSGFTSWAGGNLGAAPPASGGHKFSLMGVGK